MTSGFPSVDGATVWVNFSSRGGPAGSLAGPGSRRNRVHGFGLLPAEPLDSLQSQDLGLRLKS